MSGMWTYVEVVISPATMAMPVVTMVSHATRAAGSLARIASRTASEIWSAILSGCPSVTDSEVNTWRCAGMCLSDRGLDVQTSGAPSRGQPAVGVEQLQVDGFGERESQQVEHVGRGARGERLLRRHPRARSAHLTHRPLDERQRRRRYRQRLVAEPDEEKRRQRLRCHLAAHTRRLARLARRVRHHLEKPQHAGIV